MTPDSSLDLSELADRAGVSARTVRYYIQQGLLASPDTRGPGTRYDQEHLDRLRAIRLLQRQHLPLAEIRRRLKKLDADAIAQLASAPPPDRSTVSDYIQSVLGGKGKSKRPREAAIVAAARHPIHLGQSGEGMVADAYGERSQWDRIALSPDVELHIRRPLSREENRKLDRLVEAARDIYREDAP